MYFSFGSFYQENVLSSVSFHVQVGWGQANLVPRVEGQDWAKKASQSLRNKYSFEIDKNNLSSLSDSAQLMHSLYF